MNISIKFMKNFYMLHYYNLIQKYKPKKHQKIHQSFKYDLYYN